MFYFSCRSDDTDISTVLADSGLILMEEHFDTAVIEREHFVPAVNVTPDRKSNQNDFEAPDQPCVPVLHTPIEAPVVPDGMPGIAVTESCHASHVPQVKWSQTDTHVRIRFCLPLLFTDCRRQNCFLKVKSQDVVFQYVEARCREQFQVPRDKSKGNLS